MFRLWESSLDFVVFGTCFVAERAFSFACFLRDYRWTLFVPWVVALPAPDCTGVSASGLCTERSCPYLFRVLLFAFYFIVPFVAMSACLHLLQCFWGNFFTYYFLPKAWTYLYIFWRLARPKKPVPPFWTFFYFYCLKTAIGFRSDERQALLFCLCKFFVAFVWRTFDVLKVWSSFFFFFNVNH